MGISLNWQFYILDTNFFDRESRLSEQMKISRTAELPIILHASDTDDQNKSPIETYASIKVKFCDRDGPFIQEKPLKQEYEQ